MKKPYTPSTQREMLDLWHKVFVLYPESAEGMKKALNNMQKFFHLEKKYSTLLRELNPSDVGAKLGATELFLLMYYFDEVRPLEDWADRLGYKLVPKGDGSSGLSRKELNNLLESVRNRSCRKCPIDCGCHYKVVDAREYDPMKCLKMLAGLHE